MEDVMNVIEKEMPEGVIVQFGGQTAINLAGPLSRAGVKIMGTSLESIDTAEDREKFDVFLEDLYIPRPKGASVTDAGAAIAAANRIGYPVVVRPSYVLGGRAMEIVYEEEELKRYLRDAVKVSNDSPVLLDHFLNCAIEMDVDAVCDGTDVVIGAIMQHIEQAGVHSGDSACILPPITLSPSILKEIEQETITIAAMLGVVGLLNIQYAVKDGEVYLLEVNPRASRTVPFVSKAIGLPLAKVATRVMLGKTLRQLGITKPPTPTHISVKEAVFPFNRFPGADILLGPEMKSTGEVMGIAPTFGLAFAKAQPGGWGFTSPLRVRFISVSRIAIKSASYHLPGISWNLDLS